MHLGPEQQDALQELLNIGIGRAAGSLNQMLEKPIRMHIPYLQIGKMEELSQEVQTMKDTTLSSVQLPFKGSFSGSSCLLFPTESATALVVALTGESEDPDTMDSLREATLTEIGNIVLNGIMGSLANVLNHQIMYSVPFYQETTIQGLVQPKPSDSPEIIIWAQTQFTIEEYDLTGDIMLMFGVPDLGLLVNAVNDFVHSTTGPHVTT